MLKLSKLLNARNVVLEDVSSTWFELRNAGIDFSSIKMMKGDKTTGWLGTYYNKLTKFWYFILCNFYLQRKNKFQNPVIGAIKCTSKCMKPI